ncbi:group III truncated hemoglobin [Streptomyces sp. NPDC050625]|uniref:group III truncated hemoglobin n=1 Tax=Streptomyces sp. NPDC050625 TaxID=3154629 RepID=UPI0034176BA1
MNAYPEVPDPAASTGPTRPALSGRSDVETLVEAFYRTAFADPLIGPIFTDVARMDLAAHMPRMCDFWESVLFRAGTYHGNALRPHMELNRLTTLRDEHFTRWVSIWTATVDSLFVGEAAEVAKLQAQRVSASLQRRLCGGGLLSLPSTVPRL